MLEAFAQLGTELDAATKGYMDDVPVSRIGEFQTGFLDYAASSHNETMSNIESQKELTDANEAGLKKALEEYKSRVWKN